MATGPFGDLLHCYYDQVGPLFMSNFADSGGVQALAKYKFPHTNVQSVEPMGREPIMFSGEMVFFTSLGKDCYPVRYLEMRARVSEPDPGTLVHPVHGQIVGYFTKFDVTHSAEERNGCRANFSFEETTTLDTLFDSEHLKDLLSMAEEAAYVADAGIAALGLTITADTFNSGDPTMQKQTLSMKVTEFRTFLDKAQLFVGEITANVNEFKRGIDRLIGYKELLDPNNYEIYRALKQLSSSIVDASDTAKKTAINLIEVKMEFETSPQEIAVQWYNDIKRTPEISEMNPPRYFYYPRGTILKVPDR